MQDEAELLPAEIISSKLFDIRRFRVVLDVDLAEFFGRTTEAINQQRKRNSDRFPQHYAFQLSTEEWTGLKSQDVISRAHGGRRSPP